MSILVRRSSWGAKPPEYRVALEWDLIRGIAVHHTYTTQSRSHDHCPPHVRWLQQMALDEGYRDIEYSALACSHGFVFEGRWFQDRPGSNGKDKDEDGFHDEYNRQFLSIAVIGRNPAATTPVASAIRWFRGLVIEQKKLATEVKPHSAFVATACPGPGLKEWIRTRKYEEDDMAKLSEEAQEFFQAAYLKLKQLDPPTSEAVLRDVVKGVRDFREHEANHGGGGPHTHTISVTAS